MQSLFLTHMIPKDQVIMILDICVFNIFECVDAHTCVFYQGCGTTLRPLLQLVCNLATQRQREVGLGSQQERVKEE